MQKLNFQDEKKSTTIDLQLEQQEALMRLEKTIAKSIEQKITDSQNSQEFKLSENEELIAQDYIDDFLSEFIINYAKEKLDTPEQHSKYIQERLNKARNILGVKAS